MKNPREIIKYAQLTEKSTRLSERENKYYFEVDRNANKLEIKRAVEQLFKVTVTKVNTANYRGKVKTRRERGARYGRQSAWKRAIITVKQDQKIELV